MGPLIRAWANSGDPSPSDLELLDRLFMELGAQRVSDLNYTWAERWVRSLKIERNLSPGTISKRVQALSRAIDWHLRRTPDLMVDNPLRLLPKGYSAYGRVDAAAVKALA